MSFRRAQIRVGRQGATQIGSGSDSPSSQTPKPSGQPASQLADLAATLGLTRAVNSTRKKTQIERGGGNDSICRYDAPRPPLLGSLQTQATPPSCCPQRPPESSSRVVIPYPSREPPLAQAPRLIWRKMRAPSPSAPDTLRPLQQKIRCEGKSWTSRKEG